MRSGIEANLKLIMYWFDLIMVFTGFVALLAQLAGRHLEWLIVTLFILFLIYLAGKIWFFKRDVLT